MHIEFRWLKWANFDPVLQYRTAETEGQLYHAQWQIVPQAMYPGNRAQYERMLAGED